MRLGIIATVIGLSVPSGTSAQVAVTCWAFHDAGIQIPGLPLGVRLMDRGVAAFQRPSSDPRPQDVFHASGLSWVYVGDSIRIGTRSPEGFVRSSLTFLPDGRV